jgi:hypothetical protein
MLEDGQSIEKMLAPPDKSDVILILEVVASTSTVYTAAPTLAIAAETAARKLDVPE